MNEATLLKIELRNGEKPNPDDIMSRVPEARPTTRMFSCSSQQISLVLKPVFYF